MKKSVLTKLVFVFSLLILINLISATSVGTTSSDLTEGRVVYTPPTTPINYSTVESINSSDFWDDLDLPQDIQYSDINADNNFWDEDVDLDSHILTAVGKLIMQGVITSQDIIPITTELYSIGNSTNWFQELFSETIYSKDINTTNLISTNIQSEDVNTTNLTIGGFDLYKDGDGDLNIDLD